MKLNIKKSMSHRLKSRLKKQVRVRKKVLGTTERPRLCVFRSLSHIYAQIIDDTKQVTLLAASSLELPDKTSKKLQPEAVGKLIAEKAKKANLSKVVFDRNGYVYHGRVKALAESARTSGLDF
jgi:large subunit ribosomal protein L18